MLDWYIHFGKNNQKPLRSTPAYQMADMESISRELLGISWDEVMEGSIELAWDRFKVVIMDLENKYVPKKKPRHGNRSKPVWMSYKALKMVRKKRGICKI